MKKHPRWNNKPSRRNPHISYIGQTNFRNDGKEFGIFQKDRLMHMYILGKTGTGKTTLLQNLIKQDIYRHRGITLFDVHGDLIKNIVPFVTHYQRQGDLVHLDVSDPKIDIGYNPLRKVSYGKRSLVCSGILEVLERLWGKSSWGSKMEHILRMVILSLLDQPSVDFSDILRMLGDESYRYSCQKHIVNEDIRKFWEHEFSKYTKTDLLPVYNKIGGFLAHPIVRKVLVGNPKQISLRQIMDGKRILVLDFSKGVLGMDAAHILSSLFLSSLASAAFSRISVPEEKRTMHFIYLDEFHNYTNSSLVHMLSELRKFKVGLVMAHQYKDQLTPEIRSAILGNVGTIICFRLGQADARYMEKEFYPVFTTIDFISLENFDIYLRLMIRGKPSRPFSATTLPF